MDFDQALAVMDAQFSAKPPRYGEWFVAGQVISDHYRRHPEKLRVYTTDARTGPMRDLPRTQDQLRYPSFENSREWLNEAARGVKLDETWASVVTKAPNPGLEAAGDWVQDLPGDPSGYFIAVNPKTQKAALYRYKQPQTDPGVVGRSSGGTSKTMDRGPAYYRGLAQRVSVQRELSGVQLREINRQNREGWSKR